MTAIYPKKQALAVAANEFQCFPFIQDATIEIKLKAKVNVAKPAAAISNPEGGNF